MASRFLQRSLFLRPFTCRVLYSALSSEVLLKNTLAARTDCPLFEDAWEVGYVHGYAQLENRTVEGRGGLTGFC